jgi:hypothetical protein
MYISHKKLLHEQTVLEIFDNAAQKLGRRGKKSCAKSRQWQKLNSHQIPALKLASQVVTGTVTLGKLT